MTNIERIKAMSADEMAEEIVLRVQAGINAVLVSLGCKTHPVEPEIYLEMVQKVKEALEHDCGDCLDIENLESEVTL